jgi:hypothetical protein
MVDDLLRLCPEHGLRLDWEDHHCRLRVCNGDSE